MDADYKTPFMHACQNGLTEIVAYFLKLAESKKSDFDLNATAENENTAFHYACHAQKEDVVDLIIASAEKLKIDLHLMNDDGITGYDHWPEKFESYTLPETSKKPRQTARRSAPPISSPEAPERSPTRSIESERSLESSPARLPARSRLATRSRSSSRTRSSTRSRSSPSSS